MSKIHFQLVTPERVLLDEDLDSLSCPTQLGEITVLPDHVPLVATLERGELTARSGKQEHYIHVAGGFVEIRPHNEVVVLADAAEHHYEINIQEAEEAVRRAKEELRERSLSGQEYARVAALLQQNLTRLNIAQKHAHRRGPQTLGGVYHE
ncbi:MAG TPA: ATP synthase F1 subunit epsilon [Patescibacteria group bacterium]|nr:ATP synthase F1 subunit epsilon [Patescibacteria group bacterium]